MRGNGLGRMTWHTRKNKLVRRERRKGGGMVILEEDHCGCFLGAWLWAVGYSYPSVFFLFSIKLDQCIRFSISDFFILAI